jgi:ferredoxin-type protein NapH
MLFTGFMPESRVLFGAATVLVLFALAGGRIFCSWVCPVNPVTDLAGWLGKRFVVGQSVRASRELRYWALGLALALSTLTGVAAFEWISPIAMLHRELIYGIGLGWIAVLGVFLFDLLVMRHGWCGHLCPLGAFYGLLGRSAQLRVRFDSSTCTHCGECAAVCPEPQVLNLSRAAEVGMIASGHCTNCGRCTPICPESSLAFDWRARIRGGELETSNRTARRPI